MARTTTFDETATDETVSSTKVMCQDAGTQEYYGGDISERLLSVYRDGDVTARVFPSPRAMHLPDGTRPVLAECVQYMDPQTRQVIYTWHPVDETTMSNPACPNGEYKYVHLVEVPA